MLLFLVSLRFGNSAANAAVKMSVLLMMESALLCKASVLLLKAQASVFWSGPVLSGLSQHTCRSQRSAIQSQSPAFTLLNASKICVPDSGAR